MLLPTVEKVLSYFDESALQTLHWTQTFGGAQLMRVLEIIEGEHRPREWNRLEADYLGICGFGRYFRTGS